MNIRSMYAGRWIVLSSLFLLAQASPVHATACSAEGQVAFNRTNLASNVTHQIRFCGAPTTVPSTCVPEPNTRDLYCCPESVSAPTTGEGTQGCQDPTGDACSATAIAQLNPNGATTRRVRVCEALPPTARCVPDSNTDTAIKCCIGSVGIAPNQQCSASSGASRAPQWTAPSTRSTLQNVRWWVPRGVLRDCYENGSCTLEQIMSIASSFANFLLSVSGSLLLLAFVIGGTFYLTSAGNASHAEKGKTMIVNATIGMIIMLLAGTMVRFVYSSLTSPTNICGTAEHHPGFMCQFVSGNTPAECFNDGCGDGLKCCPITQSQAIDPMTAPTASPSPVSASSPTP